MLEDGEQAFKTKRTRSRSLINFLNRLYPDVIQWEALQLAELIVISGVRPWADFLRVQHYVNETKTGYAKPAILFLYYSPESPAIVTSRHRSTSKLLKPKDLSQRSREIVK